MSEKDRIVAVVSPWEKMSELAKRKFRIESLPEEKMVMVWRDDLETEQALTAELRTIGILTSDLRQKKPTEWKRVD
jgi:hypothetical protein